MVLYFTCVLWKLVCDALDNHSPFLLLSIIVRILLLEPTTSTCHHSITFSFIRSFIPWILLCPLNTTQSFTVLSHGITHITFLDYLPWAKCYRATSSIFKGQKNFSFVLFKNLLRKFSVTVLAIYSLHLTNKFSLNLELSWEYSIIPLFPQSFERLFLGQSINFSDFGGQSVEMKFPDITIPTWLTVLQSQQLKHYWFQKVAKNYSFQLFYPYPSTFYSNICWYFWDLKILLKYYLYCQSNRCLLLKHLKL